MLRRISATRSAIFIALVCTLCGCNTTGGEPIGDPAAQLSATNLPPDSFMRAKDPRQLRLTLAARIEGSTTYRTLIDGGAPKLKDAKFAGPFKYANGQFYCVTAEIEQPLSSWVKETRTSAFKVQALGSGEEFLQPSGFEIRTSMPAPCYSAPFEPFPELEQARNKRRIALGKSA